MGASRVKQIMCHLSLILFFLFHLSKPRTILKAVSKFQLSAFAPFLFKGSYRCSEVLKSGHSVYPEFFGSCQSSFAAAVKVTVCILVTLPTRNHVIHSLPVLHALTLVYWPVH